MKVWAKCGHGEVFGHKESPACPVFMRASGACFVVAGAGLDPVSCPWWGV